MSLRQTGGIPAAVKRQELLEPDDSTIRIPSLRIIITRYSVASNVGHKVGRLESAEGNIPS